MISSKSQIRLLNVCRRIQLAKRLPLPMVPMHIENLKNSTAKPCNVTRHAKHLLAFVF